MAITTAKEFVETIAKMRASSKPEAPPGWLYNSPDEFVALCGVTWTPPQSKWNTRRYGRRGPMGMCFKNALELAMERPELTYCEGTAFGVIPVHHAWCVDAEGRVVDPTWKTGTDYFGVPFSTDWARRYVLRAKVWGILYNTEGDWSYMTTDPTKIIDARWTGRRKTNA